MSPDELRESIKILGWNQFEAAQNLGIAPRLFRYWCAGDKCYPMPPVVAAGIRAMVRDRLDKQIEFRKSFPDR